MQSVGFSHGLLEIEFVSGDVYHYFGVPSDVHEALMGAESHGEYFNEHVRDSFEYELYEESSKSSGSRPSSRSFSRCASSVAPAAKRR